MLKIYFYNVRNNEQYKAEKRLPQGAQFVFRNQFQFQHFLTYDTIPDQFPLSKANPLFCRNESLQVRTAGILLKLVP